MYLASTVNLGWRMDWLDALSMSTHINVQYSAGSICSNKDCGTAQKNLIEIQEENLPKRTYQGFSSVTPLHNILHA